jgi:hypothetical protein
VTGSSTLQLRPFHSSASAVWLPRLPKLPTARHQAGPVQDTADSAAPLPGLGAGWTAHRRPFHRSASVATSVDPTAVQADADVHDAPARLATERVGRLLPEAACGTLTPEATARGHERAAETAGTGAWPPAAHAATSAAATTLAVVQRKTAALIRATAALHGRIPARTAARVAAQPAPTAPTVASRTWGMACRESATSSHPLRVKLAQPR